MMKRNFLKSGYLVVMLVLSLLLLAACGSSPNSENTGGEADTDKVYKLRMNSQNAPPKEGSPSYAAQEGFVQLVKEKTNGRIEIEVFYSNQLAGQGESLDALARGTIDIHVGTPAAWADKIPEGNWGSLPFAWKTEEELNHIIRDTEFGSLYAEALEEYGVKPLFYYHSAASGYLSNKPITSPEDFEGVVMNAVGTLKGNFYKEMGAGIANIPFSDYYEGLLRGTVDAVSFPYYAMESMKLGEVVKYVTTPGEVSPAVGIVAISQSTWDKLPSDLQELLMEAALESEQQTMPASAAYTEFGINYAKEIGLEIIELSDEAHQEFQTIAKKTYWAEFAKLNDRSKEMIEILEDNIGNQAEEKTE